MVFSFNDKLKRGSGTLPTNEVLLKLKCLIKFNLLKS